MQSPPTPNPVKIAHAAPACAAQALEFGRIVTTETNFLHRLPQERGADTQAMAEIIRQFTGASNSCLLHAWDGEALVGECALRGEGLVRTRHVAHLGLAVLRSHWGRGIATALIAAAEDFASRSGIVRIELGVMAHNLRAKMLYQRLGYREEGVRRGACAIDGVLIDEIVMAKLRTAAPGEGGGA